MKIQDNSKKEGGNIFVFVIAIVCSIIVIVVIWSMIFGGTSNSQNFGNDIFQSVIPVFLIILLINVIIAIIGFRVARFNQWRPLLWLNERLFSTVEKNRNSKYKSNSLFTKLNNTFNPDRLIESSEESIPHGCFKREPGEEFMPPDNPFFRTNWWTETVYKGMLLRNITGIMSISAISTILAIININLLILDFLLSVGFFFSIILVYWVKEWERYKKLFFITTHRIGFAEGQFSWLGLIAKTGVDISLNTYDISHIVKTSVDPVPDNIPHSAVTEAILEFLGHDENEKVGTINIEILGADSKQELLTLENYSNAPLIKSLIDEAKNRNKEISSYYADVESISRQHVIGKPGQYSDMGAKLEQVREWHEWLDYNNEDSTVVDVFLLARQYIENLSIADINRGHNVVDTHGLDDSRDGNETNDSVNPDIFPG